MAELVYLLCALASVACAVPLTRNYLRSRTRLLLWSSVCFTGLALNNVMLFADLVLFPSVDLALARTGVAFAAVTALVIGLASESK